MTLWPEALRKVAEDRKQIFAFHLQHDSSWKQSHVSTCEILLLFPLYHLTSNSYSRHGRPPPWHVSASHAISDTCAIIDRSVKCNQYTSGGSNSRMNESTERSEILIQSMATATSFALERMSKGEIATGLYMCHCYNAWLHSITRIIFVLLLSPRKIGRPESHLCR